MTDKPLPEHLIEENQILHDLSLTAARIAFANRHGDNRELASAEITNELLAFYMESQYHFAEIAEKKRQIKVAEKQAEADRANKIIEAFVRSLRCPTETE